VIDPSALTAWYQRNRRRSRELFDMVSEQAYYRQPIALRHPIVFYEGHLPAFSFNTLVKTALGGGSIDVKLEALFARGIDPSEGAASSGGACEWPGRDTVRAFADEADRRVLDVLRTEDLDRPGHALLDRAEAVFAILEHEAMHQETLLYIWQRLPFAEKRRPAGYRPPTDGAVPTPCWIEVPPGRATLGVDADRVPFAWDNERPAHAVPVGGFAIERHDVTNAAFLAFVDAGGYRDARWWRPSDWAWIEKERVEHPLSWERCDGRWYWRGMFDRVVLPLSWPVYVSHAEATAYAHWKGARLPSEAEFHRAAYGTDAALHNLERIHPWGDAPAEARHGAFDFTSWDPTPSGSHPEGRSAWGIDDLVGNGWEWTSTVFEPFPGFRPTASYPQYSADFFDGEHFVMKGASTATARELLRPSFRNWFRGRYPYVYATFRCARNLT
jgi:ergothioneine biosynthesis protein EgtB